VFTRLGAFLYLKTEAEPASLTSCFTKNLGDEQSPPQKLRNLLIFVLFLIKMTTDFVQTQNLLWSYFYETLLIWMDGTSMQM